MSDVKFLFPGGIRKALTLSYDDGVEQDRRLVEVLDRYGLKATFNLNSGIQDESNYWVNGKTTIRRMNRHELPVLYAGHEVAVHGLTHPFLQDLPRESVIREIMEDRKNLESWFGYPVTGMAYPYGTYDRRVIEILQMCGIAYARTVNGHGTFRLPEQFMEWQPTCHHNDPQLMEKAGLFLANTRETLELFYVWGHSYEFDVDDNWALIEAFAEKVGQRSDVWYASNIQIHDYIQAMQHLRLSADGALAQNPSALSVWLDVETGEKEIRPGELVRL